MGQIIGPSAQQIIAEIVGGAPETLNTLNEIAAAIDDNGSYAASVQNALDAKAPLNSPTFTGNVSFTGATVSGISSYSAPTLGSTSIASGATVGTISGLTLSQPTFSATTTVDGGLLQYAGGFGGSSPTKFNVNPDLQMTIQSGSYNPSTNSISITYTGYGPNQIYLANTSTSTSQTLIAPLSGTNSTGRGLGGVVNPTSPSYLNYSITQKTLTINLNSYSSFINVSDPSTVVIYLELNSGQTLKVFRYSYSTPTLTVTPSQVAYLSGVTGPIQTQFNNIPTSSTAATLSNKTISLGSNTISGTLNQFNTALTDENFATLSGTETLANKTISQPTIVGLGTGAVTGSITSGVMNTDIAETSLIIFGLAYTNESTLPQNGQQFYLTSGPVGYEGFISNPLVASNVSIAGGQYQATWTRVNDNSASRIAMIDMPLNAFQTTTYTYTGSVPVNITPTEVGYLDGVTNNIQTQLDSKAGLSGATLTSTTLSGTTSVQQILEKATVSATAATGTINYDLLTNGAVTYYTSNASANWTLNIRGNGSTTLNSLMSTGQSLTIAFLVTNGVTARYQTGFQIDGNAVSPKWQGGSAPTAGNASSIDIYSITIIKTGNAAFTALESQTRFA